MTWFAMAAALTGGCATLPPVQTSVSHQIGDGPPRANAPVWVALGPNSYGAVFEKVLEVVGDHFEIAYSNRYEGIIESHPRIAPGLEQPWKPGSHDLRERLYATLQTIRHRAVVTIQTAEDDGFFVDVKVYKELEDLARPIRATAGAASFRSDSTVERQFEVIDPAAYEPNWIPIGRDCQLEQILQQKIRNCMAGG